MTTYDDNLFVDREQKLDEFKNLVKSDEAGAVRLIRAKNQMGKSWLVNKMRCLCAEPALASPVVLLDFGNERLPFQLDKCLDRIRLIRRALNAPGYFQELDETIKSLTATSTGGVAALKPLVKAIMKHFNEAELSELAGYLDVDPENLPHETLSKLADGLVGYFNRRGALTKLLAKLTEDRPFVNWNELAGTIDGSGATVQDSNEPFLAMDDITRRQAERQLNDAFFRGLAALIVDRHPIVFLIDAYELAKDEARDWIKHELLGRVRDGDLNHIIVIITGSETPALDALSMDNLVEETELEPFTQEDICRYLEKLQIPYYNDEVDKRPTPQHVPIYEYTISSGGVPGYLYMMTRNRILARNHKNALTSS